jgi:hypothetical protein
MEVAQSTADSRVSGGYGVSYVCAIALVLVSFITRKFLCFACQKKIKV